MSFQFTYENYTRILGKLTDRGYTFALFPEALKLLKLKKSFALIRHDVDLDLQGALKLAELDAESSVRATFFLLVRTEHYNLFSDTGTEIVAAIIDLGHEIGLHLNRLSYPEMSIKEISKACRKEADILGKWFSHKIFTVSFHRPNKLILEGSPELSAPMLNTYMPLFTKDIKYLSDSRGEWEYIPMENEWFKKGMPLHILTHPIWWRGEDFTPIEKIVGVVESQKRLLERSIEKNMNYYISHGESYVNEASI